MLPMLSRAGVRAAGSIQATRVLARRSLLAQHRQGLYVRTGIDRRKQAFTRRDQQTSHVHLDATRRFLSGVAAAGQTTPTEHGELTAVFELKEELTTDIQAFEKAVLERCKEIERQAEEEGRPGWRLVLPPFISSFYRKAVHDAMRKKCLNHFSDGVGPERALTISSKNFSSPLERDLVQEMVKCGDRVDDMMLVFDKMRRHPDLTPSVHAYNVLLEACAHAGDASGADSTMEAMDRHDVAPNRVSYEHLLTAYCHGNRIDAAMSLVLDDTRSDMDPSWAYMQVLRSCAQFGLAKHADRMVAELDKRGVPLSVENYADLFVLYGTLKQTERVDELWARVQKGLQDSPPASWQSNLRVATAALGAYSRCNSLGGLLSTLTPVLHVFRQLRLWEKSNLPHACIDTVPMDFLQQKLVNCYFMSLLLLGRMKAIDPTIASTLFNHARALGVDQDNGKLWGGLLRAYTEQAYYEKFHTPMTEAERAALDALHASLSSDLDILPSTAPVVTFDSPWAVAYAALDVCKAEPTGALVRSILTALAANTWQGDAGASKELSHQNTQTGVEFVHWLHAEGLPVTAQMFNVLLQGCERKGNFMSALHIAWRMQDIGLAPNAETVVILYKACLHSKRVTHIDAVKSMFARIRHLMESFKISHTVDTFNAQLRLLAKGGDEIRVSKTLEAMKKKGIQPTLETYDVALQSILSRPTFIRVQRAIVIFQQLRRQGLVPGVAMWNLLLEGGAVTNDHGATKKIFDEMKSSAVVSPDADSYAAMVAVVLMSRPEGWAEQLDTLLQEMTDAGFEAAVSQVKKGNVLRLLPSLVTGPYLIDHPLWRPSSTEHEISAYQKALAKRRVLDSAARLGHSVKEVQEQEDDDVEDDHKWGMN